jgi:hypothetical protein
LSSTPSFITPITVYSGTRSGASRPSKLFYLHKGDTALPFRGGFCRSTAYMLAPLHTRPSPTTRKNLFHM